MSSGKGCCGGGHEHGQKVEPESSPKAGVAADQSSPAAGKQTDKTSKSKTSGSACHSPDADKSSDAEHDCCCR